MKTTVNHKVPAVNFIGTVLANIDNNKLSDAEFRQFVRNTLTIVEKPALKSLANDSIKPVIEKYYVNEPKELDGKF